MFFTWLWVLSTWFKRLIFISSTFRLQSSCLAPGSFNMPILYVLEYRYYCPWRLFTIKLCWIQFVLFFFPSVNAVKHRRWNFVQKCFHRLKPSTIQLASYLASIKLHLRCLTGFCSKYASESCSVWHYEHTSHRQL